MTPDVSAGLKALADTVAKLESLQEWAKLEQQERKPGVPPSFQPSNHLDEDLRMLQAAFFSTVIGIQEALNSPSLAASDTQKHQWHRRLEQLQQRARLTYGTESLIRP